MQGEQDETIECLAKGDLQAAPVTDAERELLLLVELLTRSPSRTTAEAIQRVRDAGWNDEQIGEAVYTTALFAMFNRVADAFGLEDPNYRTMLAEGESPPRPADRAR